MSKSWWEVQGEFVGRFIGRILIILYHIRFSKMLKGFIAFIFAIIALFKVAYYQRVDRINQELTSPHGQPNLFFAAIGSRIVNRISTPAPKASLDESFFTSLFGASELTGQQLTLERELVKLVRLGSTHLLRRTNPIQRIVRAIRFLSNLIIMSSLAIIASKFVFVQLFQPFDYFFLLTTILVFLLITIFSTLLLLAFRHDRLARMSNERLPKALDYLGGAGALPAWSLLAVSRPVLLRLLSEDESLPQSFGEVIGFEQWFLSSSFKPGDLETMKLLASEYYGTLDQLAATVKALN